jgi:hypothetical protein
MSVTSLSGEPADHCRIGKGAFDAKKFCKYLKVQKRPGKNGVTTFYIKGRRLTDSERRMLHRWRTGECETVRISTVDSFATRFDLALWEIEQEASRLIQ